MPRYLSQARSHRVSKPTSSPVHLVRSVSAPLSSLRRTKSSLSQHSLAKAFHDDSDTEDDESNLLTGSGKLVTTFNIASVQNVTEVMEHTTKSMFSELPERAGMNSVRISEVLNFQKNLPPLVSLPHVHAIISASSKVEKDVLALISTGTLIKLRVTGRGNDVTGLSDVLVLMSSYQQSLQRSEIPAATIASFVETVMQNPRSSTIPAGQLSAADAALLLKTGFLVSASLLGSRNLSLSGSSLTGSPTIARAASGTSAAVGGEAAFEKLGGIGSGQRSRSEPHITTRTDEFILSMPNIGAYLRLLDAGRSHLFELLRGFKHRQAPLYLLRERWDGAVDSDSRISQAKQIRGEFSQILPAKTKKWRRLNGLSFDWALEECLGSGKIELFETHSVGLGVRALT